MFAYICTLLMCTCEAGVCVCPCVSVVGLGKGRNTSTWTSKSSLHTDICWPSTITSHPWWLVHLDTCRNVLCFYLHGPSEPPSLPFFDAKVSSTTPLTTVWCEKLYVAWKSHLARITPWSHFLSGPLPTQSSKVIGPFCSHKLPGAAVQAPGLSQSWTQDLSQEFPNLPCISSSISILTTQGTLSGKGCKEWQVLLLTLQATSA